MVEIQEREHDKSESMGKGESAKVEDVTDMYKNVILVDDAEPNAKIDEKDEKIIEEEDPKQDNVDGQVDIGEITEVHDQLCDNNTSEDKVDFIQNREKELIESSKQEKDLEDENFDKQLDNIENTEKNEDVEINFKNNLDVDVKNNYLHQSKTADLETVDIQEIYDSCVNEGLLTDEMINEEVTENDDSIENKDNIIKEEDGQLNSEEIKSDSKDMSLFTEDYANDVKDSDLSCKEEESKEICKTEKDKFDETVESFSPTELEKCEEISYDNSRSLDEECAEGVKNEKK